MGFVWILFLLGIIYGGLCHIALTIAEDPPEIDRPVPAPLVYPEFRPAPTYHSRRNRICPECEGNGFLGWSGRYPIICPACDGTGDPDRARLR
jgi:hypothetical protein